MRLVPFVIVFGFHFAHANFDADCTQLASINKVPEADKSAFKSACVKFEDGCYKIEDKAAEACGDKGKDGIDADDTMKDATAAIGQGKGSYVTSGNVAGQSCAKVAGLRKKQTESCETHSKTCDETTTTIKGKSSTATLKCSTFGPENDKWSAASRKAPSICRAISNQLMIVKMRGAVEAETCRGAAAAVKESVQQRGENDVKASERPEVAEKAGLEKYREQGHPMAPTSTPNRIEMVYPDARACGIFGCQKNENGTYTPIRK